MWKYIYWQGRLLKCNFCWKGQFTEHFNYKIPLYEQEKGLKQTNKQKTQQYKRGPEETLAIKTW